MFTSSDGRYFKAYKKRRQIEKQFRWQSEKKKSCAFLYFFVFCATFLCISFKVASNCERESAHTEEINPERSEAKTIETAEYLTITFFISTRLLYAVEIEGIEEMERKKNKRIFINS